MKLPAFFRLNNLALLAVGTFYVLGSHPAFAQRPLGIDVSDDQGSSINWTSVKGAGISFSWTKATEGASGQYVSQASFTGNESRGKAAGVFMGAYHFAHPGENVPASEESYFWSVAGGYILADGKTLMPMLDMEVFTGVTGASTYSAWVNDWCDDAVVSAANVGVTIKPFIYASACNFGEFDSSINGWLSDIANYGSTDGDNAPQSGTPWSSCSSDDPWGSSIWVVWQYASAPPDGSVSGVSGNVDVDVFNGTATSLSNNCVAMGNGTGTIYYWDPEATAGTSTNYTGSMTGTWENSSWAGVSVGQSSPWNWTNSKAACFAARAGTSTPAFTITMNSSHVVSGIFDGGLGSPDPCNVTIAGTGTILWTSGAQAFDADNGTDGSTATLTIDTSISGTGQLVPEGTGNSYLNGTNTFTGGTALGYSTVPWSGIVFFSNSGSFGPGQITFQSYGTGGALELEGTSAVTLTNSVTVSSATSNNIVGNAAGLTFSGPWTVSAALGLGSGGAASSLVAISGAISGSSSLYKYNPGILSLNGVSSFSGPLVIGAGTLTIGGTGEIGSGSYGNTIANSATLAYSSTATQTISGAISGTGALSQTAGELILSGANTYTGNSTLSGGILQLDHAETASSSGPLGKFAANAAGSIILTGGTLQFTSLNANDYSGRFSTAASQQYNTDVNGHTVIYATALTSSGGKLTLSSTAGGGVLTLSAANTYTGLTSVNGGSLKLGVANAVPAASSVLISNGASFNMNGLSDSIATLGGVLGATLPAGNVINNNSTLTINGTMTSNVVEAGSSAYSGVISGTGNVIVSGGGSTTFCGTNTYSGGTSVTGGTLVSSFSGAVPFAPLIVNNTGVFDIVGVNQKISTLSGTGTVNLESGSLTVSNATSAAFSGVIQNAPVVYSNGASVNGLQGFYYTNYYFSGAPVTRVDTNVDFTDFTQASQNPLYPQTTEFSARWIGQVAPPVTGSYVFSTTSDDGSRCWVNGQLVVDNWNFQGATTRSNTITLQGGKLYDLRVEYIQGTVSASCVLSWTPPGSTNTPIPSTNLFTYPGLGGLTMAGTSTLTLNGTNTYAGTTTVTSGTLALGSNGSISNSTNISIAAASTFDVSAMAAFTLGTNTTLSASGSSSPATINGQTSVNLGSQPIVLTYDGSDPALTIAQGTLSLTGNAFTVNGSVLAPGLYTLIQQNSGSISATGPFTVAGTAIPSNAAATISVSGNIVQLTIIDATSTIVSAPTNSTYGQPVTLTATVSPAPGGGTVQFYDNGVPLGGLETVATGSALYTTNTLTLGTHPITATFGGTAYYTSSATTNSFLLTITLPPNNTPVTITNVSMLGNGQVQLSFSGEPGYTYIIQGTTNLAPPILWTNLGTNTADINGLFNFIDTNAVNYTDQFYQTMVAPQN